MLKSMSACSVCGSKETTVPVMTLVETDAAALVPATGVVALTVMPQKSPDLSSVPSPAPPRFSGTNVGDVALHPPLLVQTVKNPTLFPAKVPARSAAIGLPLAARDGLAARNTRITAASPTTATQ